MRIKKFVMSTLAAALICIAGTGISPNSWFIAYEPRIPESLKR